MVPTVELLLLFPELELGCLSLVDLKAESSPPMTWLRISERHKIPISFPFPLLLGGPASNSSSMFLAEPPLPPAN